MSPSTLWATLLPEWFRTWLKVQLLPTLGLEPRQLLLGVLRGMFDTLLLIFFGLGLMTTSRVMMEGQYALPPSTQATAVRWAPVADLIARRIDIPREVPLVLWFKENSMQAVNPANCTGIIGAYDLVRSGEHPCFEPGPISDFEVTEQLTIGALEFKKRCPDITYLTHNPDTIKRCYLAYNAGQSAAARLDPNDSAYVMNGYDEAHTNMVYSDIELGTVEVKALGAWPAHLAIQSTIVAGLDGNNRPISIAFLDASTRIYDWFSYKIALIGDDPTGDGARMEFPDERPIDQSDCIGQPHMVGRQSLRPHLNPITYAPLLTQDIHGCSYGLPGVDISSKDPSALLQAPMPGEVTTYTDKWYNTTIRIENEEWIVWLLHPRSYLVEEGNVRRGEAVGVMGAIGYATGPHVHYTIYDKVNETFVDPSLFLP